MDVYTRALLLLHTSVSRWTIYIYGEPYNSEQDTPLTKQIPVE